MKRGLAAFSAVANCFLLFTSFPAQARAPHSWLVSSPDHGQTFSFGSEQRRVWAMRGPDNHLALLLDFTNDPYVDRVNPREYDSFVFHFPQVKLGPDGHTFYYRTSDGHAVAVATRQPDFLGIHEIRLLPSSNLIIRKPHGYLSLSLVVGV